MDRGVGFTLAAHGGHQSVPLGAVDEAIGVGVFFDRFADLIEAQYLDR